MEFFAVQVEGNTRRIAETDAARNVSDVVIKFKRASVSASSSHCIAERIKVGLPIAVGLGGIGEYHHGIAVGNPFSIGIALEICLTVRSQRNWGCDSGPGDTALVFAGEYKRFANGNDYRVPRTVNLVIVEVDGKVLVDSDVPFQAEVTSYGHGATLVCVINGAHETFVARRIGTARPGSLRAGKGNG